MVFTCIWKLPLSHCLVTGHKKRSAEPSPSLRESWGLRISTVSVCHICSAYPCLRVSLYTSGLISVSPSRQQVLWDITAERSPQKLSFDSFVGACQYFVHAELTQGDTMFKMQGTYFIFKSHIVTSCYVL